MPTTLTPSQFTSPSIRTVRLAVMQAAATADQDLDMEQVRAELAAALRHIEDLPRQHPYEATGYRGELVYEPIPSDTHSHGPGGNANANPNTNFPAHTPILPPST